MGVKEIFTLFAVHKGFLCFHSSGSGVVAHKGRLTCVGSRLQVDDVLVVGWMEDRMGKSG